MDAEFREIAEDLRHGCEIEFAYGGRLYSVTNSRGYWNFCTGDELIARLCAFDDKEGLVERVAACRIDGVPVPDIFDKCLYDANSLWIS